MRKLRSLSFLILFLAMGCNLYEAPPPAPIQIGPKDFLTTTTYNKLIVEILHVQGFSPVSATVDNITNFLQQRLNKPNGITVVQNEIAPQGVDVYTQNDLISIENVARSQHNSGATLTLFIFFGEGDYSGNSSSIKDFGLPMSSSSIVIFKKTLLSYSGNTGLPSIVNLESTVAIHELCHLLGLVNFGSPMQTTHEDATHVKHCDDNSCLMYYNSDTSEGIARVLANGILPLNTNCLNDLKANGGL